MDNCLYPAPHPQAAFQVVDGQAVIVLADSGQVTVLNEVGSFIWQLCDGAHSVGEIVEALVVDYDVAIEIAQQDTESLLEQLVEIQAIVFKDQPLLS